MTIIAIDSKSLKWKKRLIISSVCLALGLGMAVYSPHSLAANDKQSVSKKKKAPLISQKVYKLLTEAQELVATKKYEQALSVLDKIKARSHLNSTERAQLWNFYAYIYFTLENYTKAIQAYETLLKQPELQEGLRTGTLYTLSQLYFLQEDYQSALQKIRQWMELTEEPSPEAYALLGQAYYKLQQYNKSIPAIRKAIELRKLSGRKVKESWYLLLRASYYELKDFSNMEKVVKELTTLYPKPQYFRDLMGIYSQMGKNKKQLALMEVLYERNELNKSSQIRNLASLYLIQGVPYKAAKVLDKAMGSGLLEKNQKNLELLSQSWLQAREDQRAIASLAEAAKMSGKGDLWIRLGQAHANLEQWNKAILALKRGLDIGHLKRPDSALILLGMSYYNLGQLDKAKQSFARAAQRSAATPQNKKTAKQWIKYLDSEIQRAKALKLKEK